MQIYYKYTKILPLNYFDTPTIKLSPPAYLNDPFEFNASENILRSIINHLRIKKVPEGKIESQAAICLDSINAMLTFNGIVSFSETPRNSLMWAHYADQHNGMCIGYKKDVLEHLKDDDDIKELPFEITIKEPRKINYDNLRFESDHYFESNYEQLGREATIKHLLKKSDEWIYEKEHRCIIPYMKANYLLVTNRNATVDHKYTPTKEVSCLNVGMPYQVIIKNAIHEKDIFKTKTPNLYKINPETADSVSCAILQLSKDAFHLVSINKESIHSIYFGCNVSNSVIKKYYDKLQGKYPIYKFELSKKRFELIPTLMTEDKLNSKD